MLNEPTLEKLKTLRLEGMITAWTDQQKSPEIGSLAFDERLGLLVDAEWMHRENKRMKRSLKEAKLRLSEACIEAIDFPAKRELDKALVRQLQTCRWIDEHQAVLVTGATGTGKSYIAVPPARTRVLDGARGVTQTPVRERGSLSSTTAAVPRRAAARSRARSAGSNRLRRGERAFGPSTWGRARGIGASASRAGRG